MKSAWQANPQKYFLILAGIFGIMSVFLVPPFQRSDEINHFRRVEEISNGQFIGTNLDGKRGGYLPADLGRITYELNSKGIQDDRSKLQDVGEIFKTLGFAPSVAVFTEYKNPSWPYPPVLYLPQAIGAVLAKVSQRTMVTFYLSRLFNLFFWAFAVYLAISITPCFKWGFFMLALLPTSLQQAASVSPDALINGVSFLWFAFIFKFSMDRDKILLGSRDLVVLLIFSLLLILSKAVYSPLVLLLLFIPSDKFGSKVRYFSFLTSIVLIDCIAGYAFWHWSVNSFSSLGGSAAGVAPETVSKIGFILNNPVSSFKGYFNEVLTKALFSRQFIPGVFGGVVFLTTLLVFITNHEGGAVEIMTREKGILAALLFSVTLLIFYVFLSPDSVKVVDGVQGRYFIPIGIGIFALAYSSKLSGRPYGLISKKMNLNIYLIFVAATSLTIEMVRVIRRYYLP